MPDIDYLEGDRHSAKTIRLHDDSNTYNRAMRVVARDILKTHPMAGATSQ